MPDVPLRPGDFAAFFHELWGREPFPWQARLAARVCDPSSESPWPTLLDLPTGSGKTSAIDVAVFWMAVDAVRPPAQRRAPRRVVMVVDRRVVVDQAFERAQEISEKLERAESSICARVGAALRRLGGTPSGEAALQATVLRGGMIRDDAWVHYPDRPLVAAGTVDQVGSRLLFRGYGVSRGMASVHAGLLGNDVLYLLDEVHLSRPFAETLGAIRGHFRRSTEDLADRFQVVTMSATPGEVHDDAHQLEPADRAHPVLRKRWTAAKPAQLDIVKIGARDDPATVSHKVAEAMAAYALELVGGGLRRVGVIVNRVATARGIHRILAAQDLDARLLVGRMRPLDKDTRVQEITTRLAPEQRSPDEAPVIVVSTQCLEAGADLDFDGLVSECASLDALRQRFGRLNRRGNFPDARAWIVVRSDQRNPDRDPDPVYGAALAATYRWLSSIEALDLGLSAMAEHLGAPGLDLAPLLAPSLSAPVLLPAHLDLWAQTSEPVFPDPEIAAWLHGPERSQPEVQIVWRADLPPRVLSDLALDTPLQRALIERLMATPPGSLEALPIPLWAAQRWLSGRPEVPVSDALGVRGAPRDRGPQRGQPRLALRWAGERSEVVGPDALRPGDTLVVPSGYGGLTHGCWDPGADTPVTDLGDRVQLELRGRASVRLLHQLPPLPLRDDVDPTARPAETRCVPIWMTHGDASCSVAALLETEPPDEAPEEHRSQARDAAVRLLSAGEPWASVVRARLEDPVALLKVPPLGDHAPGYWLAYRRGRSLSALELRDQLGSSGLARGQAEEASTEGDDGSFLEAPLSLQAHLGHVGAWARAFARRAGLPDTIVSDVSLAGWLHDLGKADPRFQLLLHGGSQVSWANAPEPLAKSRLGWRDRRLREQARRRSGYPRGMRHELMSVALVADREDLEARAHDWELVLHLVASHHGWCRPFPPAVADPPPGEDVELAVDLDGEPVQLRRSSAHDLARLDGGIAERFAQLQRRYGWWGLAWLEALLRLADHRASEHQDSVHPKENP